ncbi:MAG: tyrosine-type recombinase/integrase [Pseudomonadota bacterium]
MNFNALLESFLQSRILRPKSANNYRAVCRHFIAFLTMDSSIEEITRDHLVQYREYVLGRASPTTFNNYRRHLTALFSYAVEIGELNDNPWRRVRGAPTLQAKPRTVNADDLLHGLDVFQNRVLNNWGEAGKKWADFWTTLVRTLYFTGMRRRQIVELQWSDINFDLNVITLRAESSKTRKEWIIPLPHQLLNDMLMLQQIVATEHGELPDGSAKVFDPQHFVPRTGIKMEHPLTVDRLSSFFGKLSKDAGVRLSSHRIRHTVATTLVNKGGNLKAAQTILGHSDVRTTLGYVHPNMDDLRTASGCLQLLPKPSKKPDDTPLN